MTNKLKESKIYQVTRTQSRAKQLYMLEGRISILRYLTFKLNMDGVDTDYKAFWRKI